MMNANDGQRVVLLALARMNAVAGQVGDYGSDIWFSDGVEDTHERFLRYASTISRVVVMVYESGALCEWGFECAFPYGHFHGHNNDCETREIIGALRMLADEYGLRFECVVQYSQQSEQENT